MIPPDEHTSSTRHGWKVRIGRSDHGFPLYRYYILTGVTWGCATCGSHNKTRFCQRRRGKHIRVYRFKCFKCKRIDNVADGSVQMIINNLGSPPPDKPLGGDDMAA